jgi:SPP1 family predicted phage head-tail adaptor
MKTEELRYKITIQKYTVSTNENGFEEEVWQDFITCKAKVENLHGREFFQAAELQAEKTVKFTTRYLKNIDESMRIKFREKYYNITFIDNIKYGNRYMEIKALEVEQSG